MRWSRTRWVAVSLTGTIILSAGAAQTRHAIGDSSYGGLAPICRVVTSQHEVALTFDDGPDPTYTPTVLRLLSQSNAKATFFLIGEHAQALLGLVHDEVTAGMQIGDHTLSHPYLTALSTSGAAAEMQQGRAALEAAGSGTVRLFRAPYGLITPQELTAVRAQGLIPVHWTLALDRWTNITDPAAAARSIANAIRPGDIVLAHDARDGGIDRESAIRIVQALLPILKQRGYRLVTVSELLAAGTPGPSHPTPLVLAKRVLLSHGMSPSRR